MLRIALVVFIIPAAIFYMLFLSALFKVKNVKIIQTSECLSSQTVQSIILGKNILILKKNHVSSELKAKYSCADDIKLKKTLPQTISIEVIQKQIVLNIAGTNLAVDNQGKVFEGNSKEAPTLYLPGNLIPKKDDNLEDTRLIFANKLAQSLKKSDFVPAVLKFTDEKYIAVYTHDESVAIFSPEKDENFQVDSLQAILAKAKINASKIAKIDLRFDKPVIVFKP